MTQTIVELADLFEGRVERIPDALGAQGTWCQSPSPCTRGLLPVTKAIQRVPAEAIQPVPAEAINAAGV